MTAILFKAIKPKKLNIVGMRNQLFGGAVAISKDMLLDFELTTAFWDTKVKFARIVNDKGGRIEILVGTDNEIYRGVDQGTPSKGLIVAKPGKVFAFPANYDAHTTPNVLISRNAKGAYGPTIFTKTINHKGIPARNFSKLLQKKWQKQLNTEVAQIFKDVSLISGHK